MSETKLVDVVCDIIPRFEDNPEVIWRAFFCLHIACAAQRKILVLLCRVVLCRVGHSLLFGWTPCSYPSLLPLFVPTAELLPDIARNGVHEMIPDAYEKNNDPKYVLYLFYSSSVTPVVITDTTVIIIIIIVMKCLCSCVITYLLLLLLPRGVVWCGVAECSSKWCGYSTWWWRIPNQRHECTYRRNACGLLGCVSTLARRRSIRLVYLCGSVCALTHWVPECLEVTLPMLLCHTISLFLI